jgi:hypothetical protein
VYVRVYIATSMTIASILRYLPVVSSSVHRFSEVLRIVDHGLAICTTMSTTTMYITVACARTITLSVVASRFGPAAASSAVGNVMMACYSCAPSSAPPANLALAEVIWCTCVIASIYKIWVILMYLNMYVFM